MSGFTITTTSKCCANTSTSIAHRCSVQLSSSQKVGIQKGVVPVPLADSVSFSLRSNLKQIRAMAISGSTPAVQVDVSLNTTGNKQALISLSDKKDLVFLGSGLQSLGYKIVSTGGTASALENAGLSVTKVEEVTHFPEMLFNNGMKESQDKDEFTLRITAPEEAAFMDMLNCIYDRPLNATSGAELVDVLMAADKFEVTCCIRHCIQLLGKLPMTIESALFYLVLPSMVFVAEEVEPLIDEVNKYLASHFRDFTESQQEAAMDLSLSALEAVLGSDDLQVDSEDVVLDFILEWARAHYPKLEERREILTNRLVRFICFAYMSCSNLKKVVDYPDLDREHMSNLVLDAMSSKVEAPYGQHDSTFPRRVYNRRLIKVVRLQFAQPRCVVFLDLKKEECADLFPSKRLNSQVFCLGERSFYLMAQCTNKFGLFVATTAASGTCSMDFEFAVMKKSSKEFTIQARKNNSDVTHEGKGWLDLFQVSWTEFMRDGSEYFTDGILHLRVDLTLIN